MNNFKFKILNFKFASKRHSFTIIEILIDIVIIGLVATAVLSLMIMNFRSAAFAQMKVVATNLANDRMETIRNLPYDDVATEHGPILPQKNLKDTEAVNYAGWMFTVNIDARYYDDPYDHLATDAAPNTDTAPIDYKKVKVSVFAAGRTAVVAELASNIGSKAAETPSNTGILLVKVIDNPQIGEQAISGASVHIVNPTLTTPVDITTTTQEDGYAMIPKLPPAGNNTYKVTVTRDGYSTDVTLDPGFCASSVAPSPSANLNPNIIDQRVTLLTMQIRCLTNLQITIKDIPGAVQPGKTIRIQSQRLLCTDPKSKYDSWQTSDANGQINLSNIEHDSFFFTTAGSQACPAISPATCPVTIVSYGDDYLASLCQAVNAEVIIGDTLTYAMITDVTPRHPNGNYNGEFTIIGERLDLISEIKMIRSGQPDIIGTVISKESTEAVISFNLNGAINGAWDIWIKNIYNEISVKHNALEVAGS